MISSEGNTPMCTGVVTPAPGRVCVWVPLWGCTLWIWGCAWEFLIPAVALCRKWGLDVEEMVWKAQIWSTEIKRIFKTREQPLSWAMGMSAVMLQGWVIKRENKMHLGSFFLACTDSLCMEISVLCWIGHTAAPWARWIQLEKLLTISEGTVRQLLTNLILGCTLVTYKWNCLGNKSKYNFCRINLKYTSVHFSVFFPLSH